MAVIDGRVDDVDAGAKCGLDGLRVELIGSIVRLSEVGSETDGRKVKIARARNMPGLAEVPVLLELGEAISEAPGAFGGCESLDHVGKDIKSSGRNGPNSRKSDASVGESAVMKVKTARNSGEVL